MASGQFSRGKENIRADGGIVMVGNFDVDVEQQQRVGHLLSPLPPEMRNDTAFMDRMHAYAPGWDFPKLSPTEHFTDHFGLVSDFLSECWSKLRVRQPRHRHAGARLPGRRAERPRHRSGQQDRQRADEAALPRAGDAGLRRGSGVDRPPGAGIAPAREGAAEAVLQERVPQHALQLHAGPDGVEQFVSTPELHSDEAIESDPLPPGQVWAVSPGTPETGAGLYRIEVTSGPGGGVKILNQPPPPAFRESVKVGEQNLYTRAKELVGDRDPREHEFSIQMRAMDADKTGAGLGLPVLVALCGSLLGKNTRGGTIIVGALNLGGSIEMIPNAVQHRRARHRQASADPADARRRAPAAERPARRPLDQDQHRVLQGRGRRGVQGVGGVEMDPTITSAVCRAAIVTALPVEFAAVCEHLEDRSEDTHPQGTVYERGRFRPTGGGEWEVVVVEIGAGNAGAAAEVERAISYCKPDVVLFVGVAGGIKDVEIGDVVAGTKVYGYESGRESGSFRPRPVVHESNYRLIQRAKAEARTGKWRQRIVGGPPNASPRALVGPIAAGEKLVADTQSTTSQLITATYGDTLAVEMEGYGFLHGAYLNQHLAALVIRGISDLLNDKTNADRSGSQKRASRNASAFCFEVLAKLGICPGESERDTDGDSSSSEAMTGIQQTLSVHESRFQAIEQALGIRAIADVQLEASPDNRYVAEMNSARDLLKMGQGHAARFLLDRLRGEVGEEDFSLDLRFRLETNLGSAALILGEYEVAEPHFEAALSLKPADAKAIANRAQVALVRNQSEVGLQYAAKARSLAPDDPYIISVYLRALDASGQKGNALKLAEDHLWIRDNAYCAFVLAHMAYDDARYSEAEALTRISLIQDPDDGHVLEFLARCITVPLQCDLDRNPPLPGKLPVEVTARASEAESLYTKAIDILEHQDHKELLLAALANRGMVLSLIGRSDDALRDFDRVLGQNPSENLVRANKGRLLLWAGRPHEALQELEALDNTTRQGAWHPLAAAYLATNKPQKALQVLLPLWGEPSDRLKRIRLAELMLEAHSELAQPESGGEVADALEAEFPDDAEAIAIAAEWRASQPDNFDRAISLFYGALDNAADSRQKDRIMLLLADLYYRRGRFAEAADLYGKLMPSVDHPALVRRHLLSLFNSGAHREALRVAQDLRSGGPAIPIISAIEAHVLEEAGDLDGAQRILAELVNKEPDNPDPRIGLAYLRYRRGDYEGSKQAVLGIGVEEIKGNAHQLLALARVRTWLGLDGVLELAYRARRIGFDQADVHQTYVSLVLHRERDQDAVLQVDHVRPGTTVHTESDDGHKKIFTVVDGLDADLHRGELLPSDPVALRLLGCTVGDFVYLKQSEIETVRVRITKVESQYVFAFQETLLNFSTWFPDERQGPQRLTIDTGGIDKMLQLVDQRQSQVEAALELYRSNRITLGMLAQLVGHSVIQVWAGLQKEEKTRIIASRGQEATAVPEATPLASADVLTLEVTALLTFGALDLLPALKRRFKQLIAAQFVADQVNDELTLERAGLRNAGTIYRRGDRYVMESTPEFQSEETRSFLEKLLEFLKHDVCLLPTPGVLDTPKQGIGNPLGRAALAAILLAKEQATLLCSDDFVLRTVAQNDWGVVGVWSQAVVMELLRSGNISRAEYHRATMGLVQRNYTFVRVKEQDFLWLLREEGMRVTPAFLSAMRVLEGPDCTEDSAVVVAGAFLRDVCLEPEVRRTRHLIIDACISALKRERQPSIVLSKLDTHVRRLMVMNPEGLSEIREAIALWKREPELMEERIRVRDRRPNEPLNRRR